MVERATAKEGEQQKAKSSKGESNLFIFGSLESVDSTLASVEITPRQVNGRNANCHSSYVS